MSTKIALVHIFQPNRNRRLAVGGYGAGNQRKTPSGCLVFCKAHLGMMTDSTLSGELEHVELFVRCAARFP
jgi:hypothetical protein